MVERIVPCVTSGFSTPGVRTGSASTAGAACAPGRSGATATTTAATSRTASTRSSGVARVGTSSDGRADGGPAQDACSAVSRGDSRLASMVELVVRPRGPYSLRLSARLAGDATRRLRDGVLVARVAGGLAQARQAPDGSVTIRAESPAAAERLRWMLALDADHSPFLRRVERDPLLGPASRRLRGLRPLRTATVAHALLRAVCGQLVDWRTARALERRVLRALATRHGSQAAAAGLLEPPTTAVVAAAAPFELRRVGLHERRAAAL